MYQKLAALKTIKTETVFFLSNTATKDQRLNKVAALEHTIPSFIKKAELM